MENKNDNLNPQQSLDLITSMIREARGNMRKSGFYFLLWGWTIVIANLGVYIMMEFFPEVKNPFLMFAITIPSGVISMIYGARQREKVSAPTMLDMINKWIWIGFGINCLLFVIFGNQYSWQINPVIITMCAVPTLVSGIMLRFKPLVFGGISFWIMGSVIFMSDVKTQFLLAAIAVILGYLIPGYLLKKIEN